MKKIILFTLLSVMFIFLLAPIIQVKAETSIVDIEGGTEKAQSTEISTESKGAELSGSEQAFYIDDNGSLHVAEKEDTTSFFNRMYKKTLQGLNAIQIVCIIIVIIFAIIIAVALVANILGDKKKIPFYILGLVICMLAVVFIYYAQDIFAAFLHWVSK